MNDWQRKFLKKLESAKQQWAHQFEDFATQVVDPVFGRFAEFANAGGFTVSRPDCAEGNRIFKFALTENGYLLLMFSMKGLDEVQSCAELFIPGQGSFEPVGDHTHLCDANELWIETQFQNALDLFVTQFGEAGASTGKHLAAV